MSIDRSSKLFFQNFFWYPPAETRLPWSSIISVFNRKPANFKSVLCNYLDVKHCVLSESARALLYRLLVALKKKNGGRRNEVLIPGYTCYSVAAAIVKANLRITIYDVDPRTLLPDFESIRRAISDNTLALVVQHLFGYLSPLDELKQLANHHAAYLIEDSAQAFGYADNSNKPGKAGDFGLFSFGRGKPLPVGGGGALVSQSHADLIDNIRFTNHNIIFKPALISALTQIASKPFLYWIPEMLPLGLGETFFDTGFKVADMPRSIESMLSSAISTLDRLNEHRKKISRIYSKNITNSFQIKNNLQSISTIRYPIMLPDKSFNINLNRYGIRRMYPHSIFDEKSIKPYLTANQHVTPGSTEIAKKLFTLPTHMGIDSRIAMQISTLISQSTLSS